MAAPVVNQGEVPVVLAETKPQLSNQDKKTSNVVVRAFKAIIEAFASLGNGIHSLWLKLFNHDAYVTKRITEIAKKRAIVRIAEIEKNVESLRAQYDTASDNVKRTIDNRLNDYAAELAKLQQ